MLTDPKEDYEKGWVPFLGQKIFLDSKPLIPRVETEFWTEKAIQAINNFSTLGLHNVERKPGLHKSTDMIYHISRLKQTGARGGARGGAREVKVLDLFAGSGAIGIAVLAHCSNTHVTFGEIEEKHFPTIRKSLEGNTVDSNRADFIQTDVWSNISNTFDVILANPPYLSRERNTADESVVEHEPDVALFSKNDGMALIEEMIVDLPKYLEKSGEIWIEHEPYQTEKIALFLKKVGVEPEVLKDQYGKNRVTRGTCGILE